MFKGKFYPGGNLIIYEGMCPFRDIINFRAYIKNKTNKYGIKFFILSNALTGYAKCT